MIACPTMLISHLYSLSSFVVHEFPYLEQRDGDGCNTIHIPQANAKTQCMILYFFLIRFLAKENQIVTLFYLVTKEESVESIHHHFILRINFITPLRL